MKEETIIVENRFGDQVRVLKRNYLNSSRVFLPMINRKGQIEGSIHRENIVKALTGVVDGPVGKLSIFKSETEKLFVEVYRVGMRRKWIDEAGNIFVKASGKVLKFPEQVSY